MAREAGLLPPRLPRGRVLFTAGCVIGALALSVAVATAAKPGARTGCPNAQSRPNQTTIPKVRAATLCLLNDERRAQGLKPLAANLHLTRLANMHSKLMVAEDCFQHTCGTERPLRKRLKRSGYLAGAKTWGYAEDLGYESTPKQMVDRWLQITYDRASLLDRKYANVGIGLASGSPNPHARDSKFVTYTVDLGWRKPPA